MVLTDLEPEPRSGGIRVRIDGDAFATVAPEDVAELGLRAGNPVGAEQHAELVRRAEIHGARTVALNMLAGRGLPRLEVVRRLLRKGHARSAVDAAVASLTAAGLINDGEFARHYARTRARRRLGVARLIADLRRLGVAEREAEAAVREALEADGVDQGELLRQAAERKLRGLKGLPRERQVRRLRAYLQRRGFPKAEIRKVLQAVE